MSNKSTATPLDQAAGKDAGRLPRYFTPTARQWGSMILISTAACAAAILAGTHKIPLGNAAIVLMPVLWAVLIGAVIGVQRVRPMSGKSRAVSSVLLNVSIVMFLAALGTHVGPSLAKFTSIGPAIVLQEVGHIFGTVILALPVAVALGMGRAAIGATWAIDRESYLAYALQKFGVNSPIYRGVFSVWLLGSVFGAVFISLLAGLLGAMDIFDPRALALGLGLGSGSMMLGGVAALSIIYPDQAPEIMALAALSNLVTNLVGFYAGVFLSLPLGQRLYKFWSRLFRRDDEGRRLDRAGNPIVARKASRPEPDTLNVTAVIQDPEVRMKPSTWAIAFLASIAMGILLNSLGTKSFTLNDVTGVVILGGLTALAFLLAKYVPSVPSSVWVLALATLATAPFMPFSSTIIGFTHNLEALYVGLGSIALLGMNLGRDVDALKTLNWRIVIVAMLTFSASFIAAAALAQFVINV
ncbi:DUF3100 domain-containing protein [Pseudarthrobacter sp. J75]|uniref:DUF3100 domain-containing protein n=1 Tax=unclassified Pseudarthrobacter TaxID=2647000 RepID=UPI002E81E6F9|nr:MULTISPECIES: DUF3100 domain-containing protein [unclassified Pseudarthrobacter]MEE2521210.1 DUF3100 domain-containing protein [Pseudarthrobacter sp. J47]MEE2528442.1 DUF3100 domain-containing protein [Pseudarthrobacter sp. J75]